MGSPLALVIGEISLGAVLAKSLFHIGTKLGKAKLVLGLFSAYSGKR